MLKVMQNTITPNKNMIIGRITMIAAVLLLAFCACTGGRGTGQDSTTAPTLITPSAEPTADMTANPSAAATNEPEEDIVAEMMAEMTLEEKVGQLFIVRPESLDESFTPNQAHGSARYSDTDCSAGMADFLAAHPAGGIAFFGKNIETPEQTASFIQNLQKTSRIPLFIAVDEEGGAVARIANSPAFNVPKYDSAQAVGSTGDPEKARAMYSAIGKYLAELGFNLDFAPVADVNSNPNNPVIGNRAFGSNPKIVAKMVNAAINGLHKENIIACIKHFPGHGDTAGDTHDGYVALEKDWQQLSECELIPFYSAINETDMIMAAHITLTRGSTDNLPCSLSYDALTLHLRGEMGYNGVIITDALEMGAIVENYSSEESAVLAFNAGADILLMPYDYSAAFNGILSAVQTGEITLDRLNESVERILRLKAEFGMI